MNRNEMLDLLRKARNLLHKQENGEKLTRVDITLAHDYVDMVIDDLVDQEFRIKQFNRELDSFRNWMELRNSQNQIIEL